MKCLFRSFGDITVKQLLRLIERAVVMVFWFFPLKFKVYFSVLKLIIARLRISRNLVLFLFRVFLRYPILWLWGPTSWPEFCVVWLRKRPASGWGSLMESSSFVPWFSTFVFRNVPGTVLECVCICWFERNSSNLDKAFEMRDSIRLNSWDSFLVILPSISSETCEIYSSLILGTDVFRDWPFLGFSSCVSLVTAANFRLFLNIAIFLKGKCYAVLKTELFCIC